MDTTVKHEDFCLPRPGETGPRIESFLTERTDDRGRIISRPRVTRCQECGAQRVDG